MRSLLVCVVVLAVGTTAHAQHLGDRQQWQAQTENDARLQEAVDVEIIGRAAVTGLPILSEKTGVSFSVAPEDLATVGERKFTLISKGLDLKTIMVQLCQALQECHWDVDASRPEPTYCLHRNSGADQLIAWSSRGQSFHEWQKVQERLRMLEAAQRALRMSPDELDELEKTDVVLARLVRFAPLRGMVEALFSLPPDRLEELLSTGMLLIDYEDAPAALREAAHLFSRYAGDDLIRFDRERPQREWPRSFRARVAYDLQFGWPLFGLLVEDTEASALDAPAVSLVTPVPTPPGAHRSIMGWPYWQDLLLATGTPGEETADQQLNELVARRNQEREEAEKEAEDRRQTEVLDPELQKVTTPEGDEGLTFSGVPQLAASESGLSVISDYFTHDPDSVPHEAQQALPLWRLLDLVGEDSGYRWRKVGRCLVFHHVLWYDMIAREIPERLIVAYQKKLDEQGRFTVEDVAALAAAMARAPEVNVPRDLHVAGLLPSGGIFTFFRAPISPDQLAKARSPGGLSLRDMSPAQRQQLPEILRSCGGYSVADFQDITLTIRESPYGSEKEGGAEVRLELDLWRDHESVVGNQDSFVLPRRGKNDSSSETAEEEQ